MKKILCTLLSLAICLMVSGYAVAQPIVTGPPTILQEADGNPRIVGVTKIILPNGTLSKSGTTGTISFSAGGIAADTIWDAAGDTVYGTGANTAARLAKGTAYQLYQMNSGATAPEWSSTLGATGTRLTKGWFTDLEITNSPTVGGTAISAIYAALAGAAFTGSTGVSSADNAIFYVDRGAQATDVGVISFRDAGADKWYLGQQNATNTFSLRWNFDIASGNGVDIVPDDSAQEFTASSGTQSVLSIRPEMAQTGTAGYTGIELDVTETSTGSGTKNLINLLVGSVSKMSVANDGNVTIAGNLTTSAGALGTMATATATDYVAKSLFDANTIIYATSDNTPVALTMAEGTILGRAAGGNISALTTLSISAINMTAGTSSIPMPVNETTTELTTAGSMHYESDAEILSIGDGATDIDLIFTAGKAYTFPSVDASLAPLDSPIFTTTMGLPAALTNAAATTWTALDNNASAFSIGSTGKADIFKVITTDAGEGISMSGTLAVTGAVTLGSTLSTAAVSSPYISILDSDAAGTAVTDEETVKIYGQQTTTTEDGEVGDFRIATVGGSAAGTWNTNIWWNSAGEILYLGTMTDADTPAAIAGSERLSIDFNTATDNEILISSDSGATHIRTALQITDTKTITAKTADYSVLSTDMGGVLTNEGDDGTAIFTLPEASTVLGRTITFVVLAAQILNVNPADATDQIIPDTNAAGDSLQADAVGEILTLMAVTANQWVVINKTGTWTDSD